MSTEPFRMPFGIHKGRTVEEIAETERGLAYLKWIVKTFGDCEFRTIIDTFLKDESRKMSPAELKAAGWHKGRTQKILGKRGAARSRRRHRRPIRTKKL